MSTQQANRRPIHETIIKAIQRCQHEIVDPIHEKDTDQEMLNLLILIDSTIFPKNHDSIIGAIREYFCFPIPRKYEQEIDETISGLLEQKIRFEQLEQKSF